MAQDFGALTNMWMLNPWMFDPTQNSNQFSNFNNAALQFPPTYNTGPAGGVMNAATGKPIASFAAWQAANPGGTTLNQTPAQPQVASPSAAMGGAPQGAVQASGSWPGQAQGAAAPGSLMQTPAMQELMRNYQASPNGQAMANNPNAALMDYIQSQNQNIQAYPQGGSNGFGSGNSGPLSAAQRDQMTNNALTLQRLQAQGAAPAAPAGGGGGGAPNNWYAALNALANPGNPVTQGATVPMAQGFQPAGGVNQAFLGQAGAGNSNFLSALAAIQKRPQGVT